MSRAFIISVVVRFVYIYIYIQYIQPVHILFSYATYLNILCAIHGHVENVLLHMVQLFFL